MDNSELSRVRSCHPGGQLGRIYNLFKGFNPEANGSGDWVDNSGVAHRLLGQALANVPFTRFYERDLDAVYRNAAEQFMAAEPFTSFVVLPTKKILLFWFFDIYDPMTYPLLYQIPLWVIIVLSALGLAYTVRSGLFRTPEHRAVLIVFTLQTLVMAAYAVHSRYRMSIEPFLFSYAALGALMACVTLFERIGVLRRVSQ